MRIDKTELDAYATAAIVGYLARPDIHAALATGDARTSGELAVVRERLAVARAELVALRAAVAAGTLTVASLVSIEPGLTARIEADEAEETRLTTPSFLHGLITPGADVTARWDLLPTSTRREIARTLLVPELLGALHVQRRPEGRRNTHVPAVERVGWVRVEEHEASGE